MSKESFRNQEEAVLLNVISLINIHDQCENVPTHFFRSFLHPWWQEMQMDDYSNVCTL